MKLIKLSLIAALAATTAMAGDAKISGDAKLFYGTNDSGTNDFFEQGGAIGDTAVSLDYSREVADGVTLNLGVTGVSTMGLENELVGGTWVKHGQTQTAAGNAAYDAAIAAGKTVALATLDRTAARNSRNSNENPLRDTVWLDTANIVLNMGKTTAVIGRQELDTPFFKSEKWNIAANTFDAAVLVNSNIQDTTLVGAWVGRGNGTAGSTVDLHSENFAGGMRAFTGKNVPAYAAGIINKSIPMTTVQVWGYSLPKVAKAAWVQADIAPTKELSIGLQHANTDLNAGAATQGHSYANAVKVGYAAGPLSVSGAYSKRNDSAGIDIANIATGHTVGGSESNLYTEAYWDLGYVGAQNASAYKLAASYDMGAAQLGVSYVDSSAKTTVAAPDLQEAALTVSTKVGPLNADLAYVNANIDKGPGSVRTDTALIMLTAPFSL